MDGVNPSSCTTLIGQWATCLESTRFQVSVCTLPCERSPGEILESKGIHVHYLGLGKYSPRNIFAIGRLIEREHFDILHLHGYSSANFGRIASRLKGIANIVHEHAVLDILPHQYIADRMLSNFTDAAVAVSGSVKDFMVRGRSIPESKIRIIHNGIRTDQFRKSDQYAIAKKRVELHIPDDFRIVGVVSRLNKEKGVDYFIKAIPLVLQKYPRSIFLIAGEGPLREKQEAQARELGIERNIRFIGFRTDVADLLSIMNVTVIPSLTEGFGVALLEAMSVGNPIVATEVGGMREIARDGETVLFVPPGDAKELADKIVHLMETPEYAAGLGRKAQEASRAFSIEANARALMELYRAVHKARRSSRQIRWATAYYR
jgi:glycosyltransferase involved in cell wall biosynthesis